MTELVISVKALGIEFHTAVKEINNLIKKAAPTSESEGEIGFDSPDDDESKPRVKRLPSTLPKRQE